MKHTEDRHEEERLEPSETPSRARVRRTRRNGDDKLARPSRVARVSATDEAERRLASVAMAQGAYFLATGLWPILHMRSFEKVVGPKVDRWLVKTFGGLVAAVGATLVKGALDRSQLGASRALGVGTALSIAAAESVYVSKRRISAIYGVDVLAELGFVAGWLLARQAKQSRQQVA